MVICGKIVTLRAIEKEDIEKMRTQANDPWFESMVVGWNYPRSQKEQEEWYSNYKNSSNAFRVIIESPDHVAVGLTGLLDIDWKNGSADTAGMRIFSKDCRGKGFATDAYMALFRYAFEELRLNRINGSVLVHNVASIKAMTKVGFFQEGVRRQAVYKNGKYIDMMLMGITKDDYYENLKKNPYWD